MRLGRASGLPLPGPINDHTITAFLRPESAPMNGHGSTWLYPERLRGLPHRHDFCRRLLRLVLRGCQLALEAPRTRRPGAAVPARSHFYIVAEPELTALLIYAATRILPEAFSARLTFSTWEPIHGLREFDQARVVGTYFTDSDLDEEFYTTFGYALNTFTLKYSPELTSGDDSEIEYWIDRAAQGEWAHFDEMNQFFRQTNLLQRISPDDTKEAYRLSVLLANGKATSEDLLRAMKAPWGRAILDRNRDGIWPQISGVLLEKTLTDPLLAEAFADSIAEHLPEVEQAAATALAQKTALDWKPHWRLLRLALRNDVEKLRETILRILPPPPFPTDFRMALLEEISSLPLPRLRGPGRFQVLLKNCSVADLDLLWASKLNREWYVWALCHALVEPATVVEAIRRLHTADDALIQIFWEQFLLLANESQRRAILGPLFPPSEAGARFLMRSLKNLSWLPPETLLWLLDSLGAFHKDRIPFWIAEDNLRLLLRALPRMGDAAEPIWQRLVSLIDADLIIPGETPLTLIPSPPAAGGEGKGEGGAGQKALLLELRAAESQAGLSMPRSVAQVIRDWSLLRELFEKASVVPAEHRPQVAEACGRLRFDPCPVLAGYFQKFVAPKATEKEVLDDFAGFFHSFVPDGRNYHDYGARLIAWLRIVDACPPDAGKDQCQSYYLHHYVPAEFRWRLAKEMHGAGKLPDSVYDELPKPTELDWMGVPQALLFQLAGVRVSGNSFSSLICLLPAALASLISLVLSSVFLDSLVPKSALFIPAVVMLADGIALQTIGVALGNIRGCQWQWQQLRDVLWPQLRTALALGIFGAVVAGAAGYLWGASWRLVGPVAIAVLISLASVPLVSLTVPLVLQRSGLTRLLPSGIVARALASIAALLSYLVLARVPIGS